MSDIPTKVYWMGKDVDGLSREEAIEAVKILRRELESMCSIFQSMRRIDHMIYDRGFQCTGEQRDK